MVTNKLWLTGKNIKYSFLSAKAYLKRTVDHDNILMNKLEACSKSCNAQFVVPLYVQPICSYQGSDIELYENLQEMQ